MRLKIAIQADDGIDPDVSQLWRATVTEVAKDYPSVTLEHQLVDSMAMHIMNIPRNFDVVRTENLFGDISPTKPESSPARSACCHRPPLAVRSTYTNPSTATPPPPFSGQCEDYYFSCCPHFYFHTELQKR